MMAFASPKANEDEHAALRQRRTKSNSSPSIARSLTLQSPSNSSKKHHMKPKTICSSSPDPQKRTEKSANDACNLSPSKCAFDSENCNPNVAASEQAFSQCTPKKFVAGTEAGELQTATGSVAGRGQCTYPCEEENGSKGPGKATREGQSNQKIGAESAFWVSPHQHICRSRRCASNNPDYAVPIPVQPKKYLISKRHLLKPENPTLCKCCIAREAGEDATSDNSTTKKRPPCVCRDTMHSSSGKLRMEPESAPSETNEMFATSNNPSCAVMEAGGDTPVCSSSEMEADFSCHSQPEEQHSRCLDSNKSTNSCEGWAEREPPEIQPGPYPVLHGQHLPISLQGAQDIEPGEIASEPIEPHLGEDHEDGQDCIMQDSEPQSIVGNTFLLASEIEEMSSDPSCSAQSHIQTSPIEEEECSKDRLSDNQESVRDMVTESSGGQSSPLPEMNSQVVFSYSENPCHGNHTDNVSNSHAWELVRCESSERVAPTCFSFETEEELAYSTSFTVQTELSCPESEAKEKLEVGDNESRVNNHPLLYIPETEGSLNQQISGSWALPVYNEMDTATPALQSDEPPHKREKSGNSKLNAVIQAFESLSPSQEGRVRMLIKAFESLMCPKSGKQTSRPRALKFRGHFSYHIPESEEQADDLVDSQLPCGETAIAESETHGEVHCLNEKGRRIEMNEARHLWALLDSKLPGGEAVNADSEKHGKVHCSGEKNKPIEMNESRNLWASNSVGYHNFQQYLYRGKMEKAPTDATDYGDIDTRGMGSAIEMEHDNNNNQGGAFPFDRKKFVSRGHCSVFYKDQDNAECNLQKSKRLKGNFSKPQPFKLRTEERGMMKEQEFAKKLEKIFAEEERLRIPIAQGLPWTTDEPEVPPKPPVKEQTKPMELHLCTAIRAVDRADFDQYISEKLLYLDQQRLEEERLQKIAEEEEVKKMRKDMVPRAQLMPYFDRPFKPRRSSKRLTVPKEPNFHHTQAKRAKCMVWDGVQGAW